MEGPSFSRGALCLPSSAARPSGLRLIRGLCVPASRRVCLFRGRGLPAILSGSFNCKGQARTKSAQGRCFLRGALPYCNPTAFPSAEGETAGDDENGRGRDPHAEIPPGGRLEDESATRSGQRSRQRTKASVPVLPALRRSPPPKSCTVSKVPVMTISSSLTARPRPCPPPPRKFFDQMWTPVGPYLEAKTPPALVSGPPPRFDRAGHLPRHDDVVRPVRGHGPAVGAHVEPRGDEAARPLVAAVRGAELGEEDGLRVGRGGQRARSRSRSSPRKSPERMTLPDAVGGHGVGVLVGGVAEALRPQIAPRSSRCTWRRTRPWRRRWSAPRRRSRSGPPK